MNFYQSSDAGAPQLYGRVGSLTSVLDACLVNGYGTGAGTKNPAGWAIAYTGTNQRRYTMGANGTGSSFFVNDNAPNGTGQEANVIGFKTATSLTTGTMQFPMTTQSPAGVAWRKSETDDSTNLGAVARRWFVLADANTCYVIIASGYSAGNGLPLNNANMMGDLAALSETDQWHSSIIGQAAYNNMDPQSGGPRFGSLGGGPTDVDGANFMCANFNGTQQSQNFGKLSEVGILMGANVGSQNGNWTAGISASGWNEINNLLFSYPNNPDGGLTLCPVRIFSGNCLRGNLKGVWTTPHHHPLNDGDTFTATSGAFAGKSFIALNLPYPNRDWNAFGPGQWFFETSNTWAPTYPTT